MKSMHHNWYSRICSLVVAVVLIGLPVSTVTAQEKDAAKKPTTSAAMASDKAGKSKSGDDSNVKSKSNENDASKAASGPIEKSGKTRGFGPYTCVVHVDNRTGWNVNVYIDGSFRGAVGGGGDLYLATGNGTTSFYARADFTNDTYIPWGPRAFTCNAAYTWTLWP
jgi:hypothetical protein